MQNTTACYPCLSGFVRYSFGLRPQARFLKNLLWSGYYAPVFCTDLNLYNRFLMTILSPFYQSIGLYFDARIRFLRHGEIIASHKILWDAITFSYLRYLLLAPKFSYVLCCIQTHQHLSQRGDFFGDFRRHAWRSCDFAVMYFQRCLPKVCCSKFVIGPVNKCRLADKIPPNISHDEESRTVRCESKTLFHDTNIWYIDGLVQDCSNSIANAMELLQSCTKSSMYHTKIGGRPSK